MKRRVVFFACMVVLLVLVACSEQSPVAPPAEQAVGIDKAHGNPGIIPPNARVHGKTYAEWSAAWWQWLWSAPIDVNPGLDETGEFVTWGQSGPVWFIAPNYGGVSERWATIPPGKMLFVDILSWFFSPVIGDPEDEAALRAAAAAAVEASELVAFTVDGVPLQNPEAYRVQSDLFSFTLPENNMFTLFGYPTEPGTYYPGVSDGYFAMLTPLSVGTHTIYIEALFPEPFGSSVVTLHLQVVGRHGPVPGRP